MDIDIVEPQIHGNSDPLAQLLKACKGTPKEPTADIRLSPTKGLWTLPNNFTLNSDTKVLGAVYWLSKNITKDKWTTCLTLEPNCLQGQWAKNIKCYYENSLKPDLIGIPRFLGLSMFGKPKIDIRKEGLPLSSDVNIDLRALQIDAVSKTLQTLEVWGGSTIVADCGFGKTRIAVALISKLQRKTLILCNREILMLQWADVIRELAPSWTISWLQGSDSVDKKIIRVGTGLKARTFLGPSECADICIGSIETLIESCVDRRVLETFGTTIVDECHHLAAASLVHALPLVPSKNIIGLSATPDRRDGLEHAIYWLCGPASFVYKRLPSITGLKNTVEVCKVSTLGCANREKMYANGQLAFAEMLNFMAEDPRRNKYILDNIIDLLQERNKIIVVSGLVAHCKCLYDAIFQRHPELAMALVAGPSVELEKAKSLQTKIVFATYSMLEEGYDDPRLDTIILATPRSRIQQTIGRIERTHEGKLRPKVIDIVDEFGIYPNMWYKRLAFYKSRGFEIN